MMNTTKLFYLPNNTETFLNIAELKEELDKLKWTAHVHGFAFYIVQKTDGSTLHTDTGDRVYSFNIPIKFCENTNVNFYTSTNPTSVELGSGLTTYNKFNADDCVLADSLQMSTPHVINVKEIHNIVNPNVLPRITLLVRLKNTLDLSHLFK